MGLGATGLSLVRFLKRRGAQVRVVDGNPAAPGLEQLYREFPGIDFRALDVERDTLPDADFIALSPGVPRSSLAVKAAINAGIAVMGDIELFAREVNANVDVFAVTGSNGKTTTTALAGELARCTRPDARAAGNIGIPILDALAETPTCSTWVLELSSFQLESTTSLQLQSAAVINVTDNHLDRYPSFFKYAAAKERIFVRSRRQVLNRSDVWSMSMRRRSLVCSTFGLDHPEIATDFGMSVQGGQLALMQGPQHVEYVSALGLGGLHNAQNALAALALTEALNISVDSQRQTLRQFMGMPHRFQRLGSIDGVQLIDDSKATTIVATTAALEGLAAPTWLIAGGDGKGQQFSGLGAVAKKHCRGVHLIGRDADAIATSLSAAGVPFRKFATLEDATHVALDNAVAGEQILLSPACASWDMFRNYGHRAEVFANAANEWARAHGKVFVRSVGDSV